ncbi:hypothetical protein K438DRAFT_945209 [Mycena galopus ATCC 62051]|nr:hypothetical protein K438DRAFT_945209 [Mycena galopus ATCC 62051]
MDTSFWFYCRCVPRATQFGICSPSRLPPCFWSRKGAPFRSSLPSSVCSLDTSPCATKGKDVEVVDHLPSCRRALGLTRTSGCRAKAAALRHSVHLRPLIAECAARSGYSKHSMRLVSPLVSGAKSLADIRTARRALQPPSKPTPTLAACAVPNLVAFVNDPAPPRHPLARSLCTSKRVSSFSLSPHRRSHCSISTLSSLLLPLSMLRHVVRVHAFPLRRPQLDLGFIHPRLGYFPEPGSAVLRVEARGASTTCKLPWVRDCCRTRIIRGPPHPLPRNFTRTRMSGSPRSTMLLFRWYTLTPSHPHASAPNPIQARPSPYFLLAPPHRTSVKFNTREFQ